MKKLLSAWHWVLKNVSAKHRSYVYDWQDGRGPIYYKWRYDGIDYTMMRPVHPDMSVAPPYAKKVYIP